MTSQNPWQDQLLSLLWCFACVMVIFCLGGCGNAGAPPPGISAAVFAVVTAVWKLRNLGQLSIYRYDLTGDPLIDNISDVGQDAKLFFRFRAEAHLATNPSTDAATTAVAADYDQVYQFIRTSLALDPDTHPAPFIGGTDKTPGHLDLSDVLKVFSTSGPVDPTTITTQQVKRWKRAMRIVWRAAALEPALWNPSFSSDAMMELLDRRLRITERMLYQISANVGKDALLQVSSASPHGPWTDGVRVRLFEYPILDKDFADEIGAANIGPTGIWRQAFDGELDYNEGNGKRIRPEANTEFVPATVPDNYPFDLVPGGTPSDAIDHLFTASENWWDRSWIYCDHVLASLHLESLRFSKLRREGSDNTFNTAVNSHPQGWAQLRPLLPNFPGETRLMGDDTGNPPGVAQFFANIPVQQLQLGDHVVYWNSVMYGLLDDGAWSLENAIVVGIQSDWKANDIGDKVVLMGHGTAEKSEGSFREELTQDLNAVLTKVRAQLKTAPGPTFPWLRAAAPFVKWAPYGETWIDATGAAQAPWWLRIPYDPTPDWTMRALGRNETLKALPDAIEYDTTSGFTSAPPTAPDGSGPANAAYFPLWWPPQAGRWQGYISRRKSGTIPDTFLLEPASFHGKNIPGLIVPASFIPGITGPAVFAARPIVVR